ncbi:hypothetical protein [Flavobacterium sp.]|uniref:hypothetical protein n=1 Tax=Flavobacterium sp. TaxID=239 RepID=UPI00260BD4DC|nr:hypothetical protein [Flavobacterium sp.]
MKKIIFLFLILNSASFSQVKERSVSMHNDDTIIDSSAVYYETMIGKVDTRDSNCFSEIERAKKDFSNGNMTYYDYKGYGSRTRNIDFFQNEIEKLKIKYELVLVGCMSGTIVTHSFIPRDNCYRSCMDKLVNDKFGKDFFKKLDNKSDSLYVIENIRKGYVFNFSECDDNVIRYKKSLGKKYNQQFKDIDKELDSLITYPKDFKYKNEKYYSWSTCSFVINEDGSISKLKLETTFQNKYNYRFQKYFEDKIKNFVLSSNWVPAMSHGIVVKSEWDVNFRYK